VHRPLWQKMVVIGSQGPSNQSAAANPEPFRDVTTDFALMKQTRLLAEYRIQGRRLAPLTLMMVALCACSGDRRAQDSAIDNIVMKYHGAGKFTGSVLVGRDDRVVYVRSIGLADKSWRVSNTAETRFQIGSLTKQFTAALILGLVQQRRIDLDAPLSTYLPDYRAESGRLVTIRNLLDHSSGIPDLAHRPDILEIVKRPATPAEVVRNYCSGQLEFEPGSRFNYCNCGYLILGAIYERVSGQSYLEGVQRLASRAGLHDTGISGPRDVVPRLATAYVVENGRLVKAPYIEWSVTFASGGLYSSVLDLWRWRCALMDGTALDKEAKAELFAMRPFGYSFGWHVGRTDRDHLRKFLANDYDTERPPRSANIMLASHSGDLPGFHSCMTILLDGSWTVILLDNQDSKSLPDLAAEILTAAL